MLDLLDEESRFPKGTDQSLLEKLHNSHKLNAFYVKPKVNNAKFGIKHYAGEVFYDVNGLLEKNRDTFRDDVLKVLKESRFVELFITAYLSGALPVFLDSIVVSISACHAEDPGSIPGRGV